MSLYSLAFPLLDVSLYQIRIPGILHLWRTDKMDFLVFLATFLCILFLTIEIGFLVAVGAALVKLMVPISRPSVAVLGEVPGTGLHRPLQQYSTAEETPGALVASVNGPIIFSNAGTVLLLSFYCHSTVAVTGTVSDSDSRVPGSIIFSNACAVLSLYCHWHC